MKKKNTIVMILILILIVAIATVFVIIGGRDDNTNKSATDPAGANETIEIVNRDGDIEVVDKDSKAAQEYESAVQSGDRDSVETVKKNTSGSSTSSNKTSSKNTNSNNSTSKNETTKPTTANKPTSSNKPTSPQHTHSWTAVYKEVDKGYYDTVTKKVAYTKCHLCGADITNNTYAHMDAHMDNGEVGSYGTAYRYYEEKVWVPNIVKEVDYYKCSCGATK